MKKYQFDETKIIKIIKEKDNYIIYSYKEDDRYVFIKRFKNLEDDILKNKERKLLILNQTDVLNDNEKPIDLYYDNDEFIAYSMFIDIRKSLDDKSITTNKMKLDLLKKLRERIEELNSKGIYIGDFNVENFGIRSNGSIKLRNVDDYEVNGLPMDVDNDRIKEYKKHCLKIDNIDNYLFNYFTLDYLGRKNIPRKLDTEENRKLLYDLENIDDEYIRRYFIDSQKKGLFH